MHKCSDVGKKIYMKCSPATLFNDCSSQIAIWESLAAVEVDESAKESRKQMLLTKLLGF